MTSPWQLPGPSRFLEGCRRRLLRGVSLILPVSRRLPTGFESALERALRDDDDYRWIGLAADDFAANTPLGLAGEIAARFLQDVRYVESFDRLIERLERSLLFVDATESTDARTESWLEFVERFRSANHALPEHERSLTVLLIRDDDRDLRPEVGLERIFWRGAVSRLDGLVLAESLRGLHDESICRRRTAGSIAAALAGADLDLLTEIADDPLHQLIEPRERLTAYAERRGFDPNESPCRAAGTLESFDDETRPHSAWLAVAERDYELRHRVWQGELPVLLPRIESRRLELIDQVRSYLTWPLEGPAGTIADPFDLEVGAMDFFLRRSRAPVTLKSEIARMRQIRNLLAHSETVPEELID